MTLRAFLKVIIMGLVLGLLANSFGGLHSICEAKPNATQTPKVLSPLLRNRQRTFAGIRKTRLCLHSNLTPLQIECMKQIRTQERREICLQQAQRTAWHRCIAYLQMTQKHFSQSLKTRAPTTVYQASYQLQLSYLWLDYHQAMAGPPPLPPLQDFFLRNVKEKKALKQYSTLYQNHLKHTQQSLFYLKQYHQIVLRLYQRSGLRNVVRLWKLQTRIWVLSIRHVQGRFHMAFMRRSLSAFADRSRQQQWNQDIQQHIAQTHQRLLSLQKQLQQVQSDLLQRKQRASFRQAQLEQLRRLQKRLRKRMLKLQKSLTEQRSQTPRSKKIKRIYLRLQEESRRHRSGYHLVTASDSARQIGQWQRCNVQVDRRLQRRRVAAQSTLWTGVATAILGTGSVGVGLYLYLDSKNREKRRPAEATHQQSLGTGFLVAGGIAIAVGSALMLSRLWLRPNTQALHKSVLSCPPQRLFPPNYASSPAQLPYHPPALQPIQSKTLLRITP